MAEFLDRLAAVPVLFERISIRCEASECRDFADLCWGDGFDIVAAFANPGVIFDNGDRILALLEVDREIRYYAGEKDLNAVEFHTEVGVVPTALAALMLADQYLCDSRRLTDVSVTRVIRSSS